MQVSGLHHHTWPQPHTLASAGRGNHQPPTTNTTHQHTPNPPPHHQPTHHHQPTTGTPTNTTPNTQHPSPHHHTNTNTHHQPTHTTKLQSLAFVWHTCRSERFDRGSAEARSPKGFLLVGGVFAVFVVHGQDSCGTGLGVLWYRLWILFNNCGTPWYMTVDERGTRMVHQNVRLGVDVVGEIKAQAVKAGVSFSDRLRAVLAAGLGECPRCGDLPEWKLKLARKKEPAAPDRQESPF